MQPDTSGHRTTAELKAVARDVLLGNLSVTISATLVFLAIYFLVFSFIAPQSEGVLGNMWLMAATIIIRLLSGIFVSGSAFLYLNLTYEKKASLADLFHGFKEEPNKAVLLQIVFIIAALIANLPDLFYIMTAGDGYRFTTDLGLTLLIPVLTFLLTLPFSQAYYLLQDFPDRDVRSLLKASVRLMQGQKLRLTKVALSFLPLLVICVLTLFVPLLWLNSYYQATMAMFYKDLMEESQHGSS